MEWRKVKNIVILVLLVVNGFLLAIVGSRWGEVRRYEQSALDQAALVLEQNGIRVNKTALGGADSLALLTAERSVSAERALAEALLGGAVSAQNQGGGLYSYGNSRGTLSFRSGGRIVLRAESDPQWQTDDPQALALRLFDRMGVSGRVESAAVEDGSGTVTLCQLWEGVALFSCRVEFTFEAGMLTAMTGTVVPGEMGDGESVSPMNLPTALLRFMEGVLERGDVCSAVESMEPGYRLTQSFSSVVRLEPVWLISTNAANYYMNAVTGQISRLSG